VTIDEPELDEGRPRIVGILDDLRDSLEAVAGQGFRARSGTLKRNLENSRRLVEQRGKFSYRTPSFFLIRGFKSDLGAWVIEQEPRGFLWGHQRLIRIFHYTPMSKRDLRPMCLV
jgi:hypothetical protein